MHVCIRYNMERMRLQDFLSCLAETTRRALRRHGPPVVEQRWHGARHCATGSGAPALARAGDQSQHRSTTPVRCRRASRPPRPIELTIEHALDMGLKYNLGLYLSDQITAEARAARLKALEPTAAQLQWFAFAEEAPAGQPQIVRVSRFPDFPLRLAPSV